MRLIPWRRACLTPLVLLAFALAGGAGSATAAQSTQPERVLLGRSERGRPIAAFRVGNPHGLPVLVVGCIHGTERAGTAIARRLERVRTNLDLWVIPNLDPDGYAIGRRQNGRGVDLNQNWSSGWRGGGRPWDTYYPGPRPFSERETRIARNLILRIRPRVTIWFHQHMDLIWAWGQSSRAGRVYARASGLRFYHHHWLGGTAPNWQNHHLPGTASFVAELPAGALSPAQVRRHVHAVLAVGAAASRRMARTPAAVATGSGAGWRAEADRLLGRLPVSMSLVVDGKLAYSHDGGVPRAPASNEKLLLSMALLDRFGPRYRIPTSVQGLRPRRGTVAGNLWLVGHGDPELDDARLAQLARRLQETGIRSVRGSVIGISGTFTRERWAPGWRPIALGFVALPTALVYDANTGPHGYVFDPELHAAGVLTADLRALGVRVTGAAGTQAQPPPAPVLATVRSPPLRTILSDQNGDSLNFDAEVLAKLLGAAVYGPPGSTAKGARAIERWATGQGARIRAYDGSGLSYRDSVTTEALAGLLARDRWAATLRSTLPGPGQGTLAGRLYGIPVRAKTGTLFAHVSALSGWVRLRSHRWAAFSILSHGLTKGDAVALEDRLVAVVAGAPI
ncbi:MAG TPA: D-alanyl-D-alanine carboxypeptidase [Gaiellaceae bacterium]|nr:D-alanyl-D-alanine carboxypeptidase [Gaiellaceae bacterium]